MKKIFPLITLMLGLAASASSQTPVIAAIQPYGKVDKADLELKACDFEKDANAMILFDKGDVYFDQTFNIVETRHKRIKIFNDNGKKEANVRIEFYSANRLEYITNLQAETINLTDGKVEITKLDKKQLFTEVVDKWTSACVFTLPNVKPGSIIEYKYEWNTISYSNFPDWYYQADIPTKYSEFVAEIPDFLYFKTQSRIRDHFVKNVHTSEAKSIGIGQDAYNYTADKDDHVLANIPSLPEEEYMTSKTDNLQSVIYSLSSIRPVGQFATSAPDTWPKIGGSLSDNEDFGGQLKRKLANEEAITAKAKALKTDDEKIAYVFNEVKNTMKWDGTDYRYTNDGTVKAWDKKTGNSTEVNLILYHLLKQSGIKAYPMLVSTRSHGKVNPAYPLLYQFNRAVVYVPVDSTKHYIMDATNKYNIYNETPENLLNSTGFFLDKENKSYDMFFVKKEIPVRHMAMINAEITPDGKVQGKAQLSSYGQARVNTVRKYKTDGEQKYIDVLKDNNNQLKISSLKFDNMEVDSVPLIQNLDFKLDLAGSDGTYIYFNPNLFTGMHTNPFLSENRFSDIDFSYRNYYFTNGNYKLPAGYKTESLPKNMMITMPDQSISFRRLVVEQDGAIVVRYTIDYKKSIFFREDYPDLREFYKKMHEMLNEQIVLKKS